MKPPFAQAAHGGVHSLGADHTLFKRKGKIGLQSELSRKKVARESILSLAKMGPQAQLSLAAEWMEDQVPEELLVGAYPRECKRQREGEREMSSGEGKP